MQQLKERLEKELMEVEFTNIHINRVCHSLPANLLYDNLNIFFKVTHLHRWNGK